MPRRGRGRGKKLGFRASILSNREKTKLKIDNRKPSLNGMALIWKSYRLQGRGGKKSTISARISLNEAKTKSKFLRHVRKS